MRLKIALFTSFALLVANACSGSGVETQPGNDPNVDPGTEVDPSDGLGTDGTPASAPQVGDVLGTNADGSDPYVYCGERLSFMPNAPDGIGESVTIEGYQFGELTTAMLEAGDLSFDLGFDVVTNCDEAREARQALDRLQNDLLDEIELEQSWDGIEGAPAVPDSGQVEKIIGTGVQNISTHRSVLVLIEEPKVTTVGNSIKIGRQGSWCTGTMIRSDAIVLAAHCLQPARTEGAARRTRASVYTHSTTSGWTQRTVASDIITDSGVPQAGSTPATGYQFAFWTGDRAKDIGLIVLDANIKPLSTAGYGLLYGESSRNASSSHAFRVYGPSNSTVGGLNDFIMRQGLMVTNSWSGSTIRAKFDNSTNKQRTCDGDSGGGIHWGVAGANRAVLAGVLSGATTEAKVGVNNCTALNSNTFWTAVDSKVGWIRDRLPRERCVRISHTHDIFDCNR